VIYPVDPNSHPDDEERLSRQALAILERLRIGPATNMELATITHRFGARLHDLRHAGFDYESARGAGGIFTYRLVTKKESAA
jgi:hypothetical protein